MGGCTSVHVDEPLTTQHPEQKIIDIKCVPSVPFDAKRECLLYKTIISDALYMYRLCECKHYDDNVKHPDKPVVRMTENSTYNIRLTHQNAQNLFNSTPVTTDVERTITPHRLQCFGLIDQPPYSASYRLSTSVTNRDPTKSLNFHENASWIVVTIPATEVFVDRHGESTPLELIMAFPTEESRDRFDTITSPLHIRSEAEILALRTDMVNPVSPYMTRQSWFNPPSAAWNIRQTTNDVSTESSSNSVAYLKCSTIDATNRQMEPPESWPQNIIIYGIRGFDKVDILPSTNATEESLNQAHYHSAPEFTLLLPISRKRRLWMFDTLLHIFESNSNILQQLVCIIFEYLI